jgi:hypothetical protein
LVYVGGDLTNLQRVGGGTYYAELGGTARVVSNAAATGPQAASPTAPSP